MQAGIRTPQEVIALVVDKKTATDVRDRLLAALRCVPGTLIFEEDGDLAWGHITEGEENVDVLNKERKRLTEKKDTGTISPGEEYLLSVLQVHTDYDAHKKYPMDTEVLERLESQLAQDIAQKTDPTPKIVVRSEEPIDTGEKEFYLNWQMIKHLQVKCPKCGEVTHLALESLHYPVAGKFDAYTVYCNGGHSWKVNARLDFEITVEDETLVLPGDDGYVEKTSGKEQNTTND